MNVLFTVDANYDNQRCSIFFPSKILCFYEDPSTNQIMALVHCCSGRQDPYKKHNKNCKSKVEEEDSIDDSSSDGEIYAPICEEWFLEYHQQYISSTQAPREDNAQNSSTTVASWQGHSSSRKKRLMEQLCIPVVRSVSVECFGIPLFVIQETPGVHE